MNRLAGGIESAEFGSAVLQNISIFAFMKALLRGSRNSALADDPELGYMDAVDLRVVFFERE